MIAYPASISKINNQQSTINNQQSTINNQQSTIANPLFASAKGLVSLPLPKPTPPLPPHSLATFLPAEGCRASRPPKLQRRRLRFKTLSFLITAAFPMVGSVPAIYHFLRRPD
jgi:hypothetical protein